MPTIAAGFGQISLRHQIPGNAGDALTVLGWAHGGDPAADAAEIAAAWGTDVVEVALTDSVVLQDAQWVANVGGDMQGGEIVLPTPVPGGLAVATLPMNCAALVRKGTALAGRRGNGRMYLPGIPEGEVDSGGLLTTGHRAVIQGAVTTFLATTAAADVPLHLLHSPSGPEVDPPSAVPAATPITSLTVLARIATQRKRLRD